MEWKKFEELDREYPEAVVEKRIIGFENATEGLANLAILKLNDARALSSDVSGDFKFDLILYSNILKQYKFRIMSFGYGITLSPIYFKVESSFSEELFGEDPLHFLTGERKVENTKQFDIIIGQLFQTKAFDLVVRGLIKVAKKNLE